jgi:carbamoyltransferase
MRSQNSTLAIYGVQDIDEKSYPHLVHDHNITLAKNGKIKKFLQLERYTQKKYDQRLPKFLLEVLRKENVLSVDELDVVFVDNIIGRAFINQRGNVRFEAPLNDKLSPGFEEGRLFWLDQHKEGYVINHEMAHVYSNLPFYGEFEDNSLHVHFDGGASQSNFSAWHFQDGKMNLLEYNWDLEYLSNLFNSNALTFSIIGAKRKDQNSMPGKFMGYSSYGEYDPKIEEWLKSHDFFKDIWNKRDFFFKQLQEDWYIKLSSFDLYNSFIKNIAATIQYIFERDLLLKLDQLKLQTNADYLYYSGGSALNIKANRKIVDKGLFKELFIPPCTNDSGLSLGAAAYLERKKHGKVERHSPYLNNWLLENPGIQYSKDDIEYLIQMIMENKIIGICNGFGEAGPRALGNRSIVGRPDSSRLAETISQQIKRREWYRPVAPIMLQKNLEYFVNQEGSEHLARYMLLEFNVRPERRAEIEGCVHVDGTARIQTIGSREENTFMYDLLSELEKQESIKALVNTSFNVQGKPIVHAPDDARMQAKELGLDYLVINGKPEKVN